MLRGRRHWYHNSNSNDPKPVRPLQSGLEEGELPPLEPVGRSGPEWVHSSDFHSFRNDLCWLYHVRAVRWLPCLVISSGMTRPQQILLFVDSRFWIKVDAPKPQRRLKKVSLVTLMGTCSESETISGLQSMIEVVVFWVVWDFTFVYAWPLTGFSSQCQRRIGWLFQWLVRLLALASQGVAAGQTWNWQPSQRCSSSIVYRAGTVQNNSKQPFFSEELTTLSLHLSRTPLIGSWMGYCFLILQLSLSSNIQGH